MGVGFVFFEVFGVVDDVFGDFDDFVYEFGMWIFVMFY